MQCVFPSLHDYVRPGCNVLVPPFQLRPALITAVDCRLEGEIQYGIVLLYMAGELQWCIVLLKLAAEILSDKGLLYFAGELQWCIVLLKLAGEIHSGILVLYLQEKVQCILVQIRPCAA